VINKTVQNGGLVLNKVTIGHFDTEREAAIRTAVKFSHIRGVG
jgi:hypothetical protein